MRFCVESRWFSSLHALRFEESRRKTSDMFTICSQRDFVVQTRNVVIKIYGNRMDKCIGRQECDMLQPNTCLIIYLISKLCEILSRVSSPPFSRVNQDHHPFFFPSKLITSMQMLLMLGFIFLKKYIYTQ
jgi:hypothetical protein